jgi:hypothetical protein
MGMTPKLSILLLMMVPAIRLSLLIRWPMPASQSDGGNDYSAAIDALVSAVSMP